MLTGEECGSLAVKEIIRKKDKVDDWSLSNSMDGVTNVDVVEL